jgi:hypothetical protein
LSSIFLVVLPEEFILGFVHFRDKLMDEFECPPAGLSFERIDQYFPPMYLICYPGCKMRTVSRMIRTPKPVAELQACRSR